jgi:hypothetical protein
MDLCLFTIGGRKFSAYEIDILYLLMEDDDGDWTVGDIAGSLPYIADNLISVTVPNDARNWLNENSSDIDDAFILLNPDMFDVTVPAEA